MCRESAKNPHITARNECYFSQYQIGDILIYRGMVWINQYFLQYLNQKAHLAPSPLFLSYLHLHIFIYIHIVYIYIYLYKLLKNNNTEQALFKSNTVYTCGNSIEKMFNKTLISTYYSPRHQYL